MSDDEGHNRLWGLAYRLDWPAVHRLLEASSDEVKEQLVTDHSEYGASAIHWCARYGAPAETAHAVLQAGPRGYVNVKTNSGMTPAMWAAIKGHADVLRQLINAGADPNIIDNDGDTARSLAVGNNKPDSVAIIRTENGLSEGVPTPCPSQQRRDS